jgi:hypothetical protein
MDRKFNATGGMIGFEFTLEDGHSSARNSCEIFSALELARQRHHAFRLF